MWFKFRCGGPCGQRLRDRVDKLGEPIGKQDQYITAYGGVNEFTFDSDDSVHVDPLYETHEDTKNWLTTFYWYTQGRHDEPLKFCKNRSPRRRTLTRR